MKIITISGLDGSGKSTQTGLLKKHLESQGKRVFYFHAIQSGFAKKVSEFRNRYCLICRLTGKCKQGPEEKSVTRANWLQIQLRKAFFLIDILRFKKLRSELEKQGFDYIISDRYFYDTVVNLAYLMKRNAPPKIERLLPQADSALYLQTEPEAIMRRPRVPDQGLDYLKRKKELYDMYATLWDFKMIDGGDAQEKISEKIISLL